MDGCDMKMGMPDFSFNTFYLFIKKRETYSEVIM